MLSVSHLRCDQHELNFGLIGPQIRVYGLAEALMGEGARPGPIAAHRLSAKLSSLAWSPALPGVITVGDYDGSVLQVCARPPHSKTLRAEAVYCVAICLIKLVW